MDIGLLCIIYKYFRGCCMINQGVLAREMLEFLDLIIYHLDSRLNGEIKCRFMNLLAVSVALFLS
jgi:hypothetical protein